jgi:UDP-glucose 4-epimerase
VRSGIEIYGRHRGSLTRPDESAAVAPTSAYGRAVAGVESVANSLRPFGIRVGAVRLAPVVGPHVPSPLGRLLRLPAVPFSALADPAFSVIEGSCAARAMVAAARIGLDEPVNVVAPGAVTARQALQRGRRVPVPLLGPEWAIARATSHVLGAPVPQHLLELMHRGRLADGRRAQELLGLSPRMSTSQVIDELYRWPSVVRQPPRVDWAVAS